MSRLHQELKVATPTGIAIAAVLALAGSLLWVLLGGPVLAVRIALATALAIFIFVYGFLVSYVHGDAKRRGMRAGLWAIAAACVPHGLGFVAYVLLREPLLPPCGGCGAAARRDFAFCPQCGTALRELCPACRRPIEAAFRHCVHCGTKRP
jgi:hypothetical protein